MRFHCSSNNIKILNKFSALFAEFKEWVFKILAELSLEF